MFHQPESTVSSTALRTLNDDQLPYGSEVVEAIANRTVMSSDFSVALYHQYNDCTALRLLLYLLHWSALYRGGNAILLATHIDMQLPFLRNKFRMHFKISGLNTLPPDGEKIASCKL